MHEQRAPRWANNSGTSEVTFQDAEGAQPLRTPRSKRRKEQGKKSLDRVWREPRHARAAISPPVHAHWCADVQRCGARLQAQRAPSAFAFILAKCKSPLHIFLKVPQGLGLYNRASS